MPYYEYRCPSNGRVVEVRHGMNEHVETWGEVARLAGQGLGATPADSPVERLLSAPIPTGVSSTRGPAPEAGPGCGPGCACARPA
jgi:hypothetical protein